MKLFVLFAQRIQNYDGEYAPEALEVATEFMLDENDELQSELLAKCKPLVSKEFVAMAWLKLSVDADEVRSYLTDAPEIGARILP